MNTLNYKEIYYTSSERSIITHSAGIGVRTYTEGMDSNAVNSIAEKCVFGYSLDDNRKLTFDQIQQNPKIVYDYPPTYVYQKVTLDNGETKYILGRTIYLGIDYGYFCNRNEATRTGTNYFTHLLVFNQTPPSNIFAEIESCKLFVPCDYTCSPNNLELKQLLTGEPRFLSPKVIDNFDDIEDSITPEFAQCIIALLQSYRNLKINKDISLTKLIIKAPDKLISSLIKGLSLLPHELVESKTFLSNYMQGYGVPDDFNMIFVNEFNNNKLYENNHICINLLTNYAVNIDDNYIYAKIVELAKEGDSRTVKRLIIYYLSLDLSKDLNYNFLYNLFIAIESNKELQIDDISNDFINQLGSVHLTTSQETSLWDKINHTVNQGLKSTHGAEIKKSINAVGYILVNNRQYLNLSQESRTWITNAIFEKSYLGKIVNIQNLDSIIYILDRGSISSEETLYNALNQTNDIEIWYKLLQYYYGTSLKTNIESALESILQSSLNKKAKDELINKLYPVGKCKNELLSYLLRNTKRIPELIEVVKQICLGSHEERFSLMIQYSNNDPSIIKALSPIVVSYYDSIINREPNVGIKELLDFVDKVSVDVFNMMGTSQLFATYVDMCMQNPTKKAQTSLSRILNAGLKLDRETSEKMATLNGLFENEVPKKVDLNILHTAHKMNKDTDYIRDLYEGWLKSQPTYKELKEYVKNAEFMFSDIIEELILSTWNSRTRVIRENREEYVLAIVDNVDWKGRDKKAFIKSCRDKALIDHLTESDKLMKKLFRKILNLFK